MGTLMGDEDLRILKGIEGNKERYEGYRWNWESNWMAS